MKITGALTLVRWFGIPVKIHWSFGLLLVYVVYTSYANQLGIRGGLFFGMFLLSLFFCVVLHEFGHALTAKKFGVNTLDIILLPIGGVARLTHIPQKPLQELWIALAGPMVNVLIAAVIALYLAIFRENAWEIIGNAETIYLHTENFLPLLLLLNITLVFFNMIPAFPMDGGRVLRALVAIKWGRLKATRVASILGQLLAISFMGFGIFNGHFILAFIGLFIFFSAGNEYRMVRSELMFNSGSVRDIMRINFTRVNWWDSMSEISQKLEDTDEKYLLVFNEFNQVMGVLSVEAFQIHRMMVPDNPESTNWHSLISEHFTFVQDHDKISEIYRLMKINQFNLLPVMNGPQIVGVIDMGSFGW